MKVLVIGGGISDEREVSLRSAQAVFNAVPDAHFKEFFDWTGGDEWIKNNADRFDLALPILHGVGGEDGQIQAILEASDLAYLGTGVEASQICIDKQKTQAQLAAAGMVVPAQVVVDFDRYQTHELASKPHVLKPVSGGSSIDTFVCRDLRLEASVAEAVFAKHSQMILEEFIDGPEITVPVLEGYELPTIEIIPGSDFFDFTTKYDGSSQEICNSDNIPQSVQVAAQGIAKKCHEILNCRHLSRVDIMLDQDGNPYVIEVNTMPGLTDQSLFPKAAAYIGLSMSDLVEHFIQLTAKQKVSA